MKPTCHSSEVYAAGYAVPTYDIVTGAQTFRHRDLTRRIKLMSVPQTEFKGWPVAKWADVLAQPEIGNHDAL